MLITSHQVKAARGLLGWTQDELANHAALEVSQVRRFERDESKTIEILEAIERAFTLQGIEFITEGVRKRRSQIQTLRGQQGFWDFYDDVYETVRVQGGNILISNVDEKVFWKWLGDRRQMHKERMAKLDNFVQKIIVKEGTSELLTTYTTTSYRELPENQFSGIPFYLYGSKLAIINFQPDDVQIFVIDEPQIAAAYEKMFFGLWDDVCHEPGKKGETTT